MFKMRKLLHVVNINDFFPELFALCFPTIQAYARRNGYAINMITERKFPDYPINYEKMQVYKDGKEHDEISGQNFIMFKFLKKVLNKDNYVNI